MAARVSTALQIVHERALLRQGQRLIAGVDEVGRGAWAGPIVAAAVILPLENRRALRSLAGVRDSKELRAEERVRLNDAIFRTAIGIGVGWASHHVVDRDGLGQANQTALQAAVRALRPAPDALLIDFFPLPLCELPQTAIPHGDASSLSIAAASIVAKVLRDRWMQRTARRYPQYGFERHKGYGTANHREALTRHGICVLHRRSFLPIAAHCV